MTSILATTLLLVASTEVKAEYDVFVDNQLAGKATLSRDFTPLRNLLSRMRVEIVAADGRVAVVNQESEYEPSGKPVRKMMMQGDQKISVAFGTDSARVKVEDASGSKESVVRAPVRAELKAASEFWFVTESPKRGDIWEYVRFDMGSLKWVASKVRYVGEESIKSAIGEVVCHRIDVDSHKTWVAADGLPVRLESGGMRLERVLR